MKNLLRRVDKPLLIMTLALCIIGLVMVYSSSSISSLLQYEVDTNYFFKKQLLFMLAGIGFGFLFLLRIPISKYRKITPILVIGLFILFIFLQVYGTITNSAKSWLNLGFISIQPSEFAKSVIIILMACFYGQHVNSKNQFIFMVPIVISGLLAFAIFIQPDLGTAAILGMMVFFMFMAVPFDKKNIWVKRAKIAGSCGILLIVLLMIFGGELLNSEQTDRLTYKAPCTRYQEKTGYQVCNGMIAINNGGLFGVGLGRSTQKYLYIPEGHTDFIFPIIVEELGSLIGTGIIILYMLILFRILKIAKTARNLTGSLIAYGTFLLLLLHLMVNFGGILALIPLTGVPLPLLSYGGSFTINVLVLIFLTLRVSIESKEQDIKRKLKKVKA